MIEEQTLAMPVLVRLGRRGEAMDQVQQSNGAESAPASELERALAEKTALLHEVDHRVKNNLQLISSLILLQSRRSQDEAVRTALRGVLERVSAIATVHRRLFQSGDVAQFDVADFVRDLTTDLAASAGRGDIQIRLQLDPVAIPASQAAPLALVTNELIGNCLKHAFPGRPGAISISTAQRDDACVLTVGDDGVGRAPDAPDGFGGTIVKLLTQQLRGQLAMEDAAPGVRAALTIPLAGDARL
jgi:two-component sensor histidine kinase